MQPHIAPRHPQRVSTAKNKFLGKGKNRPEVGGGGSALDWLDQKSSFRQTERARVCVCVQTQIYKFSPSSLDKEIMRDGKSLRHWRCCEDDNFKVKHAVVGEEGNNAPVWPRARVRR